MRDKQQGALANLTGKVVRGPVATQVVRDYRKTSSTDKLPVCLPELGLSGKTPVSYQTALLGGAFSERTYRH